MRSAEQERSGLAATLGRITESVARLVSEHLALARVEVREDARAFALAAAKVAVFVPLILVGYAFVCAAIAVGLATLIGLGWALLLVGAVNLVLGGVGAALAASKLKGRPVLESTRVEVNRTTETLIAVSRPANGVERRLGA